MATQQQTTSVSTWTLDPVHSQVGFNVKHMMITRVRGRFTEVEGMLELDEENPAASSVDVEIDASSIDTRAEDRDTHLRSDDFLGAETHPRITFRSERVEGLTLEPGSEFRVSGDLTIRGVTQEVTLDAVYEGTGQDPWGGERVSFSATTTIDRRDYGLEWNQALETGGFLVGNQVRIELEAQGVREE